MANLVTVTKEGRIFLKIGGIAAGALLLIYIIVKGGELAKAVFFPKPPPVPLQAFGKLPRVPFPSKGSEEITYTINTTDGELPAFVDRVNVYTLITPEPNLRTLETAKNTLDSENFVLNQVKISDTLYQWTQAETGVIIKYDIITKNFTLASNYLYNPDLGSNNLLPDEQSIQDDTLGFLRTIQANTENIDLSKTKVEYLEKTNGIIIAAQNLGTARYARINFQQNAIDEISIVYDKPSESTINFVVSYPASDFKVLEGQFFNPTINMEQKSDYPIKTTQEAFANLKNGNAYIINPQNLSNVDITNVELHYYLSNVTKDYLLPVIVFTGINNFTAYVEAISPTSLLD